MKQIIQDRSFLPKINIIHSDRASHFKNLPYQQFVEDQGILISRASADGRSNQVVERTFRTLKNRIRQLINPQWSEKVKLKDKDPIRDNLLSPKKMASIVLDAITWYNNKVHKALFGVSPNQMEEALFLTNNQKIESVKDQEGNFTLHEQIVPPLTKNEPSIDALTVNDFKIRAIKQYAGDWQQYALIFFREAQDNL